MKLSFVTTTFLALISFASAGDFTWQSLGGQPGDMCSVALVESDTDHVVLEISVPGFSLGRVAAGGAVWDCVDLPGNFPHCNIGLPEVPSISRMFALPYGSRAVVTIENVDFSTYSGINLVPVQTPSTDMPHNPFPFRQDDAVYETDSFFPGCWAQAVDPALWGGIQTERLLVYPFRFNPATGKLMAARSIIVRIDFEGISEAIAFPSTEAVRNAASRLLVNYSLVDAAASASTTAEAAEYVFVTTDANLDRIMPLVEFYQCIGYETSVQAFSGPATPDEIKSAIMDNYDTATTRFALIAGDFEDLPSYNYGSYVGDYWYACLIGQDLVPEIAVGRLTGSGYQIQTQVSKIIEGYYQYNFEESSSPCIIPATGVLAAHQEDYPEGYTACCNEIAAAAYSVNLSWFKIYPPEGGTSAMLKELINNGVGSVGYRGHSYVLNWTWNPGWSKTDIQALTNTFMPPVWSIACYSGQYQTSAESLAESFVWDNHGASGILAATSASYTDPNHTYMKQIYQALYRNSSYNVGEALNEAAVYTISEHGGSGEDNAKMFIWFGDPAMEIFTNDEGNPEPLEISCVPGSVHPGFRTIDFTVTCGGSPVSGATVALSDGIGGVSPVSFQRTAATNSSGKVSITVEVPEGVSQLYTGARLHNYNPVTKEIPVTPLIEAEIEGFESSGIIVIPNPVTATSSVNFTTQTTGQTTVQLMDLSGRTLETIVNDVITRGNHSVSWTPGTVPAGVYFVNLSTPAGTASRQILILN